jgi:hypothetical protein
MDKFWESVGEGLGNKWLDALAQPVLFFWAAGLLTWVQKHQPDGWQALLGWWNGLGDPKTQIVVVVLVLVGVMLSSQAMHWIERWLLRVMEGYHWPQFVRHWAAEKICAQLAPKKARWQALNTQIQDDNGNFFVLRASAREEYTQLDIEITQRFPPTQTPPQPEDVMPTAVGNRLKAAELHPQARYGMDSIITWPRLWPLLSDELRQAISEARVNLNAAARLLGWGLLTCVWVVWGAIWAVPLGLMLTVVAWFRAVYAAEVYGDLIRTAFDLHRFDLYAALQWPRPPDSASERVYGERLTQYLFRGILDDPVIFIQKT